jgi:hypothetical protein
MVGGSVNVADVMQEIADRLATISGLRVYAFPADDIQPPAAVVTFPGSYVFDQTYGRGSDRLEMPVVVMVAKPYDRAARANLAPFADGSGASSVKAVVESGTYTTFDSARVTRVDFDVIAVAGIEYLAATFTVDIFGPGA